MKQIKSTRGHIDAILLAAVAVLLIGGGLGWVYYQRQQTTSAETSQVLQPDTQTTDTQLQDDLSDPIN